MPAQWTAELVAKMHLHGITNRMLARQANVTPEYVTMVLNGHREPKKAEEFFNAALDELLKGAS